MRYQYCISIAAFLCAASAAAAVPTGARAVVGLLESTDVHSNLVGYDYFRLAPEPSLGLERTASLIAQARQQYPNNLLFDNGDTIQGSALADYEALVKPLACDKTLAVYKVMNLLGYDGGGIGNHEFNYGLPYLNQVTGSRFDVAGVDPKKPRCAGPALRRPGLSAGAVQRVQREVQAAAVCSLQHHRQADYRDGRGRQAASADAQGGHYRLYAADHHVLG
jgi:2',3'-cyclic-nucleotide 2'-phosphodiesterase / 3'-nucleotidase